MPVAIEMNFEGATLEQYDKIIELMGLTSGNTPPRAIFHWTAKSDDGIRVVDVWESRRYSTVSLRSRSAGSPNRQASLSRLR